MNNLLSFLKGKSISEYNRPEWSEDMGKEALKMKEKAEFINWKRELA